MKHLLLLLLAMSAWSAVGQDVVPNRRRNFQPVSSSSALQLATNSAAYRWVSSDLTLNSAISGNWTDRIQGVSWKQGAAANQPTNSSTGVWLDSSHFLTNGGLTFNTSNLAFGLVWDVIDPGNFAGSLQPAILSSATTLSCDNSDVQIQFASSSGAYQLGVNPNCAGAGFLTGPNYGSLTNVFNDLLVSQVLTNNGTIGQYGYTNGILSAEVAGNVASLQYWGASGASPNYPPKLGRGVRSTGPSVFLRELWIWTNAAPGAANGTNLLPATLSNWHKAMTNLYGYSP